jgi:hypothetical protein
LLGALLPPVCWAQQARAAFLAAGEVSAKDRSRIVRMAEQQAQRIEGRLGLRLHRTVLLILYPNHRAFVAAMGKEIPRLAVGVATQTGNTIHADTSGALMAAEQALGHEIVHAVLAQGLGAQVQALPLWFNEGLAQVAGERSVGQVGALLGRVAQRRRIIPLSALRQGFPATDEDSGVAYLEAESAALLLLDETGWEGLQELLADVGRGAGFGAALKKATGETLPQFERRWQQEVSHAYRYVGAELLVDGLIFGVMAALAVWAYLVARRRRLETRDEEG